MTNRRPPAARGSREYANSQIRVIGADNPPFHASSRLRLPGERRRPRLPFSFRQLAAGLLVLAAVAGAAVGIYFGVVALIETDDAPTAADAADLQSAGEASATEAEAGDAQAAESAGDGEAEAAAAAQQEEQEEQEQQAASQEDAAAGGAPGVSEPLPTRPAVEPAQVGPTVSETPVSPAEIGGAPVSAPRLTAEPVPAGIPRMLADGADYDPADATAAFSAIWPVGTTLRLTRLGGGTLLNAAQEAEVVGSQLLVVVRGAEESNSDLQLSAAAFSRIAVYGVERVIAVQVEATAAPPR